MFVTLLVLGCHSHEWPEPTWEACAHLNAAAIAECSGIVHSRQYPGVFWVHNDSGDMPRLFAVDLEGTLLREVHATGADNVDWEDIAADDRGHLYIGDFGNNRNTRTDLVIYVIEEPNPRADAPDSMLTVPVIRRIPFHFPEQRAFPDPTDRNYDCEALFWDDGNLYLLTKHRSDTRTVLYRIPQDGEAPRAAERLGEYDIGSQVTAADLSADGDRLVVLSYQYIHVFERPARGDDFLAGRSRRVLIEGRQCEGICFDGENILITNEQREVFCLQLEALLEHGSFLPTAPRAILPRVAPGPDDRLETWPAGGVLELHREPWMRSEPTQAPSLRVGWSEAGLWVHLVCPVGAELELDASSLLYVMAGSPAEDLPEEQGGHSAWEVRLKSDGTPELRAFVPRPGDPIESVVLEREAGALVIDALIPLVDKALLFPGAELGLNVIVLQPADGEPVEWAWAGSSSTQPLANPLLWGRAELGP
jgi:hypothetical protein